MSDEFIPRVIGIASGKGGVGKTTVTLNMASALVARGFRVMVLDADLGLANVQIGLGCQATGNLGHVLRGECQLEDIIVTARPGLRLIPGASGMRELAALDSTHIFGLISAFSHLKEQVDFLLVDIAAGISPPVLSFLGACHQRFIVVCDQPASIADAYGLIKVMTVEEELDQIYMIGNMVSSQAQGQALYRRLSQACSRFLNFSLPYLTSIESDESVIDAWRRYQPVLEYAPASACARDFRRLAEVVAGLPMSHVPSGRVQFFLERMIDWSNKR